jgi:hypothetical protein
LLEESAVDRSDVTHYFFETGGSHFLQRWRTEPAEPNNSTGQTQVFVSEFPKPVDVASLCCLRCNS